MSREASPTTLRVVPAGEFKARCLQLMDEVLAHPGLTLVITKRGKPVAQLTAPPAGLKMTGPTATLAAEPARIPRLDAAAEEPQRKKRKGKKKRK